METVKGSQMWLPFVCGDAEGGWWKHHHELGDLGTWGTLKPSGKAEGTVVVVGRSEDDDVGGFGGDAPTP